MSAAFRIRIRAVAGCRREGLTGPESRLGSMITDIFAFGRSVGEGCWLQIRGEYMADPIQEHGPTPCFLGG